MEYCFVVNENAPCPNAPTMAVAPRRRVATSTAAYSADIRSEDYRGVYVEVHGGPTGWAQWKDFIDSDQHSQRIRTKTAAGGIVPPAVRLQKTTNASTSLIALEHAAAVYLRFLALSADVGVGVADGTDATRPETAATGDEHVDVNRERATATNDDQAFHTAAARYLRSVPQTD